jgi:uncharacterized protein
MIDEIRHGEFQEGAMTRSETIRSLQDGAGEIRNFGAVALFLFGSAARDTLRDASDVDMFIDYDEDSAFSFVELTRLKDFLEKKLGRSVDLTTRAGLHPRLRADIERSSIRIF